MKKIKADFYQRMEEVVPETKTVELEVEGEKYEIELKNRLNMEDRNAILEDMVEFMKADFEVGDKEGSALMLLVIYKGITDIEFPESLADQMTQFAWLLDTGVIKAIDDNIRTGLLEETANFMTTALTEMTRAIDKDLKKNKVGNRIENKVREMPKGRALPN